MDAAVLGLWSIAGARVGLGLLVTDAYAFTCTHVLQEALGSVPSAGDQVRLDRPLAEPPAHRRWLEAEVVFAEPADDERNSSDIALLRLNDPVSPPPAVRLLSRSDRSERRNPVRVFGFPRGYDDGLWHNGVLRGRQAGGLIQVDPGTQQTFPLQQGFSGSPVEDVDRGGVAGILVKVDRRGAGFVIPAAALLDAAGPRLTWKPSGHVEPLQVQRSGPVLEPVRRPETAPGPDTAPVPPAQSEDPPAARTVEAPAAEPEDPPPAEPTVDPVGSTRTGSTRPARVRSVDTEPRETVGDRITTVLVGGALWGGILAAAALVVAAGWWIVASLTGGPEPVDPRKPAFGTAVGAPLTGHGDEVTSVAVGELDGRAIAVSGGEDGTVRVWDALTGEQIHELEDRLIRQVGSVAVGTLNGRTIAVVGSQDDHGFWGGDAERLRIWDLETGDQIGGRLDHELGTYGSPKVAIGTQDGRPIAVSAGGGALRAWDFSTGEPVGEILTEEVGHVTAVALGDLDGRPVVATAGGNGGVGLWDVGGGQRIGGFRAAHHTDDLTAVAFGELDGRRVVFTGSLDKSVRAFDVESGEQLRRYDGHTWDVAALAVGRLGGRQVVVSAGRDRTIQVWNPETCRRIGTALTGHTGAVTSVAVGTVDGRPLAVSGGADQTVRVWSLGSGESGEYEFGSRAYCRRLR